VTSDTRARQSTTRMRSAGQPSSVVASLVHGLKILDMFSEADSVIGIGEMAKALDVHRSSASRLAATLAASGYLARAGPPGRYRLGARLLQLGELAAHELDFRSVTIEELRGLVDDVGETAHAGVLEGVEVISIIVVDGWHSLRLHGQVGKRAPAHCSSLGKALLSCLSDEELGARFGSMRELETRTSNSLKTLHALKAELSKTRSRGYSLDDEELEEGLRCVGAPILDRYGKAVASISVSGPIARMKGTTLEQLKAEVPLVARRITERLAKGPAPVTH
jgi:DNA-binding IclR family transcriptional regulator